MREIRQSGSEGGDAGQRCSLPLCASVMVFNLRGGSPRREEVWLLVAEGNCIFQEEGWGATGGERSVRNVSELDSAFGHGEPPR
jgi:hypothetical protein